MINIWMSIVTAAGIALAAWFSVTQLMKLSERILELLSYLHGYSRNRIDHIVRLQHRTIYEIKSIHTPYNQRTTKPSAYQDARYIRRPRQSQPTTTNTTISFRNSVPAQGH